MHTDSQKKRFLNNSLGHKRTSLHAGWVVSCVSVCVCDGCCVVETCRLCSLCGQAALMHCRSYLMPGKVNEVVALLEEVEMG